MRQIVILLGPPGVGKGTAAKSLISDFGFHWFSSGELLRSVKNIGSEVGQQIAHYIDAGRLVPDGLMIRLVDAELGTYPRDGRLLLDGFPRTLPQAKALDRSLAEKGDAVRVVVELQAETEELERRILKRAEEEGRSDDTVATLRRRLRLFQERTAPLTEYYSRQQKLCAVDAMGTPAEVVERVRPCIEKSLSVDLASLRKEIGKEAR